MSSTVYGPTLLILADNEDMHESLDEFEFPLDLTTDPHRLIINRAKVKSYLPICSINYGPILLILAGNENML